MKPVAAYRSCCSRHSDGCTESAAFKWTALKPVAFISVAELACRSHDLGSSHGYHNEDSSSHNPLARRTAATVGKSRARLGLDSSHGCQIEDLAAHAAPLLWLRLLIRVCWSPGAIQAKSAHRFAPTRGGSIPRGAGIDQNFRVHRCHRSGHQLRCCMFPSLGGACCRTAALQHGRGTP